MLQLWDVMEHRWGERVDVNIDVLLSAPPLAGIDGHIKNLSLSGALVVLDYDLRLHSLIEMTIKLPRPPQHPMTVPAYVSRKLERDVGLEWCEFAPRAVKEWLMSVHHS